MTLQVNDKIILEGKELPLLSRPLWSYYLPGRPLPEFEAPMTACWRGYIGTWKIEKGRLYLVGITASVRTNKQSEDLPISNRPEIDGTVKELRCRPGDRVAKDEVVAVIG